MEIQRFFVGFWNIRSKLFFVKNLIILLSLLAACSTGMTSCGYSDKQINGVKIEKIDGVVKVWVGKRSVLVYNIDTVMPPRDEPDYYKRSGFIHPLYSPRGEVLTDDFPVGHVHQHGMFFAWTKVTYMGDQLDFWNQHNGTGTVKHVEFLEMQSGADSGMFKVRLQQVSHKHGPVLDDIWTIRVLNRADPFEIEIDIEEHCATEASVILEEHRYGGFAYRGRADWNEEDHGLFVSNMNVLTREGKSRIESNHTRPGWIATWGPAGDGVSGVAILDHPDNFRYPQPIRMHPKMPYFVYSPSVAGQFVLEPGKTYHSRYKVVLFDGEPDTENIELIFKEFGKK